MKYIAPTVLNAVNATNLIQGAKISVQRDSLHPTEENSNGAGYGADE